MRGSPAVPLRLSALLLIMIAVLLLHRWQAAPPPGSPTSVDSSRAGFTQAAADTATPTRDARPIAIARGGRGGWQEDLDTAPAYHGGESAAQTEATPTPPSPTEMPTATVTHPLPTEAPTSTPRPTTAPTLAPPHPARAASVDTRPLTGPPTSTPAPTPVPPPPPPPTAPPPESQPAPGAGNVDVASEEVALGLINKSRQENGLPPLAPSDALRQVARAHAMDMAARGYFSHANPEGQRVKDRVSAAGIPWNYVAENIGWSSNYGSPADGVRANHQAMMAETPPNDSHRRIILSPNARKVGIGVVVALSGKVYYVANFTD